MWAEGVGFLTGEIACRKTQRHESSWPIQGTACNPIWLKWRVQVGRRQMMLNKQAEVWLWRTLCTEIKHLNFNPKEIENWSIFKKWQSRLALKKVTLAKLQWLPISYRIKSKSFLGLKPHVPVSGYLWNYFLLFLSLTLFLLHWPSCCTLQNAPPSGFLHLLFSSAWNCSLRKPHSLLPHFLQVSVQILSYQRGLPYYPI